MRVRVLAFGLLLNWAPAELAGSDLTAHDRALQLAASERFQEAEHLVRAELRRLENVAPDDLLGLITARTNLALTLLFQNKLTAAEAEARRALTVLEAGRFKERNAIRGRLEAVLGKIDFHSGRYREAEEHFREVLQISNSDAAGYPPDLAVVLNDLALTVAARGDFSRARTFAEDAVEALGAAGRTTDAEYGRMLANLGLILLHQKEWTKADAAYGEAIAIMSSRLDADHPHLGVALAEHAQVLKKLGHGAEAKAARRRADLVLGVGQSSTSVGRHTVDVRALNR